MKRKLNLTEEQEQRRRDGLRLLARVIVRHYLAHPELYDRTADADRDDGRVNDDDAIVEGAAAKEARK